MNEFSPDLLIIAALAFIYLACQFFGSLVAVILEVLVDERNWWPEIGYLEAEEIFGILPWIFLPVVGPMVFFGKLQMLCRLRQFGAIQGYRTDPADFPF